MYCTNCAPLLLLLLLSSLLLLHGEAALWEDASLEVRRTPDAGTSLRPPGVTLQDAHTPEVLQKAVDSSRPELQPATGRGKRERKPTNPFEAETSSEYNNRIKGERELQRQQSEQQALEQDAEDANELYSKLSEPDAVGPWFDTITRPGASSLGADSARGAELLHSREVMPQLVLRNDYAEYDKARASLGTDSARGAELLHSLDVMHPAEVLPERADIEPISIASAPGARHELLGKRR